MANNENEPARGGSLRRAFGFVGAWLVAVAVLVTIAVWAVTQVGDSLRGRGPLGNEVDPNLETRANGAPQSDEPKVDKVIAGKYGEFQVTCRGTSARAHSPRAAAGWRTIKFERGPDDDIDAVFSNGTQAIDLEVYCNGGVPTVAEVESDEVPERGTDED